MICGYVVLDSIPARLSQEHIQVEDTAIAGIIIFMISQQLLIIGPSDYILSIWVIFGFLGTSGILAYSVLSQAFPPNQGE